MFGEKPIFGQTELTIDNKGRIYIPTNTKREPGEELLLIYNSISNFYEIYGISKLTEKFEELNKLMMTSKNKTERTFYEKRLYELSKSILRSEKVDCNGRILTGKTFEGQEKVLSTGAYDHLIIELVKNKK